MTFQTKITTKKEEHVAKILLNSTIDITLMTFSFLEFERSSLETHNMHRRMHGVRDLKLNYRMSIEAEEYARKIAQKGRLDHSGTDDGENIASVCRKGKSLMTGMEASNIW